jgi:signal recognition particle receptor subunit beta
MRRGNAMAQINFAKGEVQCKVVYYGPAESGKTANLRSIHELSPERIRGKLTTIATDANRTLFFDFLSLNLGKVANIRTKINIYAVPYIAGRNALRILVLEGVDGIVFVADAARSRLDANREALANLRENLEQLGRDQNEIPIVFQANKMDAEDAMPASELAWALDLTDAATFDASAVTGTGVVATLKKISHDVIAEVSGMMALRPVEAEAPMVTPPVEAAPVEAPPAAAAMAAEEPADAGNVDFTPAWHRPAPDETSTSTTSVPVAEPIEPSHHPIAGVQHGVVPGMVSNVHPSEPADEPLELHRPFSDPEPMTDPAPETLPPELAADLRKAAGDPEPEEKWEPGPTTDPYMKASENPQPFPAFGGGMATPKSDLTDSARTATLGEPGARGRVRARQPTALDWGPAEVQESAPPAPTSHPFKRPAPPKGSPPTPSARPISDRRQRRRPQWRAQPPSVAKMAAGAIFALLWLAATGILVHQYL